MWDKEGKGRHQYQIQKIMKAKRVGTGNRKEEIVLIRLRLGHCALNKTLQMVAKHQCGLCDECHEEESVGHVILQCRKYNTHTEGIEHNRKEIGMRKLILKSTLSMTERAQVRELLGFF